MNELISIRRSVSTMKPLAKQGDNAFGSVRLSIHLSNLSSLHHLTKHAGGGVIGGPFPVFRGKF